LGDGSKGVKVGTRIAVTADAGDDVSSLDLPPEESPAQKSEESIPTPSEPEPQPQQEASHPPPPEESSSSSSSGSSAGKAQAQKYPLYPSVQHLLLENGMSKEDANKIPASGPSGRLLKGDVLAYLGQIDKSYSADQSSRITKLGHLDLSNIKVKEQIKKQVPPKEAAKAEAVVEPDTEIALPVSLTAVLACQKRIRDSVGIELPLSTFIARAVEVANDDLPRPKTAPSVDELFNAVLGLDKVAAKTSRGSFVPQVTALPPPTSAGLRMASLGFRSKQPDIMDILSGKVKSAPARRSATIPGAAGVLGPDNVFSVTARKGEEKRAKVFLERVKSVLEVEPGRLVL